MNAVKSNYKDQIVIAGTIDALEKDNEYLGVIGPLKASWVFLGKRGTLGTDKDIVFNLL